MILLLRDVGVIEVLGSKVDNSWRAPCPCHSSAAIQPVPPVHGPSKLVNRACRLCFIVWKPKQSLSCEYCMNLWIMDDILKPKAEHRRYRTVS